MSENLDPESYYKSLPLELHLDPSNISTPRLAIRLRQEDPRILPALGRLAREARNDLRSRQEAIIAAFLLGRQYEQSAMLETQYNASPNEEPITDEHGGETLPPAT